MGRKWFAVRLTALRQQAGLTQAELAERCGMNKFSIAKLEQGQTGASWETIVALCRALGIGSDRFFPPEGVNLTDEIDGEEATMGRPKKGEDAEPGAGESVSDKAMSSASKPGRKGRKKSAGSGEEV